ncbi:MAG TPA: hypothetical protein VMQ51_07515 [Candidatus Binatia bacterium]|nr:hypothetical protein [Candidatus Binatia bacterium]
MTRAGLWALIAAHVWAGWGTQWDIQWHLRIGRDTFWIAPHLITYSGVTAIVLVSFGVLAWTSWRALRGEREAGMLGMLGVTGTRGWHFAAWAILLTVLAAPIDDLWHRLFGLDVTLWSPPHLLGLLGAVLNAAACWVIAREVFPAGSRAREIALVLSGALVTAGLSVSLQPSIRMAYVFGGVRFFTYAILGALLLPLGLVVTARLARHRAAPLLALAAMLVFGFAGSAVARAGFAWLQPVSFIGEEIAKDPTSPIALAHELARKNGTAPGAANLRGLLVILLGAAVLIGVDARRRPVAASVALGLTLCAGVGVVLSGQPAFAQSLPARADIAVAVLLTALAGAAGGALAARAGERLKEASP